MKTNRLLITLGDSCGIGSEIIAQAFVQGQANDCCVVGDVAVLRRALRQLGLSLPVVQLDHVAEAAPPDCLPVWQVPGLPPGLAELAMGQINAASGAAAAACIRAAVAAIQSGQAAALVTAPIHKEAWAAAGVEFPGHTEMLQSLAAAADSKKPSVGAVLMPVRMMLANDELRTVLVTIHCSLRQAIEQISQASVLETIVIAHQALQRFGLAAPRIAVAGLNPHAGEGGLFGDEEILHIAPAIAQARALGINAQGPFAPDTVFMRARHTATHAGEFDLVVAMTHDHGLIPVKYLGVEQGVNVTLGLPFVRTSPDHGTAFDIAGSGQADASSLLAAIRMARRLLQA
jgi:4-hydroxythreonine-4-phosphate dehydrogenase